MHTAFRQILENAMTAQIIDESASVGKDVTLGPGCIIKENVVIGNHSRIGSYVVIHPGTRVGEQVRIDDHAVLGKQPMRAKRSVMTGNEEQPAASIGNNTQIGTSAIIYAGCTIGDEVLVADLATIREDVSIGHGTIVGRGVAIENACSIGSGCKLETNVYVTARTVIGDHVFVAPGVLTSNDNFLGRTKERFKHFGGPTLQHASRVGVGAVILPGKTVESEAVVAAGAVLTTDARAATVYKGVPAQPAGSVPDEQLLDNAD